MSENVIAIAVSSGASRASTPSAVVSTSGKAVPGAGKISPARAVSIDRQSLADVVQQLNIASLSIGRALRFQVDPRSGDSIILVLNRETGELIRQIPPEDVNAILSTINRASNIQLLDDVV